MKADDLRRLLDKCDLSQQQAARLIGVNPRTMRRYVLGESEIPLVVEYALRWVTLQQRFPLR